LLRAEQGPRACGLETIRAATARND